MAGRPLRRARAANAGRSQLRNPEAHHPAYKGSEFMDYDWWVQHYAPAAVRAEIQAARTAALPRYVPTEAQLRQAERDEAEYGRKLRAGMRREEAAYRRTKPARRNNPSAYQPGEWLNMRWPAHGFRGLVTPIRVRAVHADGSIEWDDGQRHRGPDITRADVESGRVVLRRMPARKVGSGR